jgi:hypothetical protein
MGENRVPPRSAGILPAKCRRDGGATLSTQLPDTTLVANRNKRRENAAADLLTLTVRWYRTVRLVENGLIAK